MNLRVKIVAAIVVVTVGASVAIGAWSYFATSDQLRDEIDASLDRAMAEVVARLEHERDEARFGGSGDDSLRTPGGTEQVIVQAIDASGAIVLDPGEHELPVGDRERALAAGSTSTSVRRDVSVGDDPYRMLTQGVSGGAVQVARNLEETHRLLDGLLRRTLTAVAAAVVVAALVGWWLARRMTRRLLLLTAAADEVRRSGRLDVKVPVGGRDETARLGGALDAMLGALARSRDDQQRLIQDAGHELRTPLTSLRTNVSVARRFEQLSEEQRTRLLEDLDGETRELTELVNELVELATDQRGEEPVEAVGLAEVVERVAARVRRRTGREVRVDADATVRRVRPLALERAIGNLLDNAAKFDEGPGPLDVRVANGRVEVLDRGPGIAPEDRGRIFDRFYRTPAARSRPGSGLGLSIVHDIVLAHGGEVFAVPRDGGGACVGFTLPELAPMPGTSLPGASGAPSTPG